MALLADAANQVLTLDTGDDHKSLVPIVNPMVRRRERQGAGKRAATAATTAARPQAKSAFSKSGQAPTSAKVKEESKPARPVQETSGKASSETTKNAAPALKRGASSGIMQAFSKAAAKPAKAKKAAESPKSATPSGEDSSMQPMSDDGEDDEELPQPKPRSASGFKSKKQREEDLRRMMEEDEQEEEASENPETPPEEEPMEEEEPPAPEPVKEEETEVVTASADGRRRGKRRVMRKKQIMDDQGYLGRLPILFQTRLARLTMHSHHSRARLGVFLGG
jgi:DNA polymerase delta subunit 3